jgi:GT2 family glycosyltransferase
VTNHSTTDVYILIPVHNRKAITLACLAQLKQYNVLNDYWVVVIDDGSTDGTAEEIYKLYPEVILLSGDGDLWWTGAIALGMQYAYQQGAELLIWLNDDCKFAENTLSHLVLFCREHENTIVGCQGNDIDQPDQLAFGGKRKTWQGYRFIDVPFGDTVSCDLLSGNLVCLPRSVIEKIGYPDATLVPHYGGDSLFLIRAKKAGFQIFVDRQTEVFSLPGESKLYPQNWLFTEGSPWKLLNLVFIPQSGLSWRVWLRLNWEAYSFWGLIMFIKKYSSILLITLLRCLPISFRKKVFTKRST